MFNLPESLTRSAHTKLLRIKQERPSITFAVGLGAGAVGVVMACRATLKAAPVIEEFQDDVKSVKETSEDPKDLVYAYWRGSLQLAKLYAPSAAVLTLSAASLTGSHIEMRRRNAVLSAAYATAFTALEKYRDAVREKIGEEDESALYNGIVVRDVEDQEGVLHKDQPVCEGAVSPYSFIFDEYSKMWRKGDGDNRDFLMIAEQYFNDLLRARGHVFLNEVLSHLGIDPVPQGQLVGWRWNSEVGDNHIDFGMYEVWNANFLKGYERSVMLDFNVDGPILDALR